MEEHAPVGNHEQAPSPKSYAANVTALGNKLALLPATEIWGLFFYYNIT